MFFRLAADAPLPSPKQKENSSLIAEIKIRPDLWCKSRTNPSKTREHRTVLWNEVITKLEIDGVDEAKRRWEILRDIFRRELKKGKIPNSDKYRSTWYHFNEMMFLIEVMHAKNKYSSIGAYDLSIKEEKHDDVHEKQYHHSSSQQSRHQIESKQQRFEEAESYADFEKQIKIEKPDDDSIHDLTTFKDRHNDDDDDDDDNDVDDNDDDSDNDTISFLPFCMSYQNNENKHSKEMFEKALGMASATNNCESAFDLTKMASKAYQTAASNHIPRRSMAKSNVGSKLQRYGGGHYAVHKGKRRVPQKSYTNTRQSSSPIVIPSITNMTAAQSNGRKFKTWFGCNASSQQPSSSPNYFFPTLNLPFEHEAAAPIHESTDGSGGGSIDLHKQLIETSDYHFAMSLIPFMKTVMESNKLRMRMRLVQVLMEENLKDEEM